MEGRAGAKGRRRFWVRRVTGTCRAAQAQSHREEIASRVYRHYQDALARNRAVDFDDLIRLPMNMPHGLFNKSEQPIKCLFWVTPTRKLYDLFWAIHGMKEQNPPDVVALSAKHEVVFLPPPEA